MLANFEFVIGTFRVIIISNWSGYPMFNQCVPGLTKRGKHVKLPLNTACNNIIIFLRQRKDIFSLLVKYFFWDFSWEMRKGLPFDFTLVNFLDFFWQIFVRNTFYMFWFRYLSRRTMKTSKKARSIRVRRANKWQTTHRVMCTDVTQSDKLFFE